MRVRKLLKVTAIAAAALLLWTASPLATTPVAASPAAAQPAATPKRSKKPKKTKKQHRTTHPQKHNGKAR
jgi:hypothetical protein